MYFVADIGGTNLRTAIVDENGTVLCKSKRNTPRDYGQLLRLLKTEFDENAEKYQILGCCFSIAGAIFNDGSVWLPNVFGLNRFNMSDDLRDLFSKSSVFMIDDRVSGLLGELWKGCAVGRKDALYLVIGTGVGLGIFANGVLISGTQNLSGSVGWIKACDPLTSEFKNIEDLISGPAIVKRCKEICKVQVDSPEDVFRLHSNKNECAEKIIVSTSQLIGYLLSVLTNTFNPDLIILAGSLSLQWSVLKENVLRVLKDHISPFIQQPTVQPTSLGEDAQLIGCVKYILISQERSD
ncbi:ROK family protein [Thermotoga profunda]|uniref:ROK family protein n=1 Tax=Thermotoga profunda TaxID=1508420 RepID=UPI000596C511|nr:ROK family protein [Thermotoga profunda]